MPRPNDEFDDDRPRRPRDESDDDGPPRRPKSNSRTIVIVLVVVLGVMLVCGAPICIGLMLPAVQSVREAANRTKSSNNLKQIGLGMANYEMVNGELPGNSYGPDGKPLLSWRVHILPYIEQDALYKQFKLDEPWDSPNNRPLLQSMPNIYVVPSAPASTPRGSTHYRGFSSPGAVFDRRLVVNRKRPAHEMLLTARFKDGPSNTALVVEAADPVEWTRPHDLDAAPGKPAPRLGGFYRRDRSHILVGDGTVRTVGPDLPETTVRALATHSSGDALPANWDQGP